MPEAGRVYTHALERRLRDALIPDSAAKRHLSGLRSARFTLRLLSEMMLLWSTEA